METKWSDYRNAVYGYLKRYKHFQGQMANIELEAQGIEGEMKSLYDANLAVQYGEHTPGGYHELSPMERVIVRKEHLEAKLSMLRADFQRIASLIRRIDNAMLFLGETERSILRMKFIEGERWLSIAMKIGYSERRCQDIANRAVDEITGILFPESTMGQQRLNFIFFEPSGEKPGGEQPLENVGKPVDNPV